MKTTKFYTWLLTLVFFGIFSTFSYAQTSVADNKILIRKIITAPEYQQALREADDIVRSRARSGIRGFLKRLQELLNRRWAQNQPLEEEQLDQTIEIPQLPSADDSPGLLTTLIQWLMSFTDTTLSLLVILPILLLLITLLHALLHQYKIPKRLSQEKVTATFSEPEDLCLIFEKLLAHALYSQPEPKLLPPDLTHRKAAQKLKNNVSYNMQTWNEILKLMELYRFHPREKNSQNYEHLLNLMQILVNKK